jgi:IclR family pca regulon transcriptional regulator
VQYIEASYPLTARFILGERSPVHVTASGLVALAEFDGDGWQALALAAAQAYPAYADIQPADIAASIESARRDGIAIADETYQKGVRAIATAIRDRQGSMVAALSLVAPVTRLGVPELLGDAGLLIETARQIGEKIPGGIEMLTSGRGKVFQNG